MNRRNFIKNVGTAAATSALLGDLAAKSFTIPDKNGGNQHNVVFILSDDHRYDFMGFMGKPAFLETPNMDRMAAEGIHFENAFVTTSLCSPSRASIFTGMYTHKHTVVDNDAPVPDNLHFFPEYLQQAGYETAFIGKWHMGHHEDDPRPGFDHWVSFKGQGVYYDPELNVDGARLNKEGYITDILTDYAVEFLNKPRSKPFFLFLSHKAVHALFEPAKRHLGKYENVTLEYPQSMADTEENYKDKPQWVREQRNSWHGVDFMYHGEMDFDTFYRRYCETILGIDDSIGRLMQVLTDKKLTNSTVMFYMGDNGFCFGEHGLIDKRQMYEPSMRVPMMAWAPGLLLPKIKLKDMVRNIDVAPTIMDLAGLKADPNMDGHSFVPLMTGKKIAWINEVFYEYYWERAFPQTPTMFGVRTDQYKYITYQGIWDIDELYDISNDPDEMHNLINKTEYGDLILELRKKVYDWLEQTGGMKIPLKRSGMWQANKRRPEIKQDK